MERGKYLHSTQRFSFSFEFFFWPEQAEALLLLFNSHVYEKYRTKSRVRLPGYLLGYCRSAAACIRIQDVFIKSGFDDNKSHKNLSNLSY